MIPTSFDMIYIDHIWISITEPITNLFRLNIGDEISFYGKVISYSKKAKGIRNRNVIDYKINNLQKLKIYKKGSGLSLAYLWAMKRRAAKVNECTCMFDKILIPIYQELGQKQEGHYNGT